jgi:hypothetical protein
MNVCIIDIQKNLFELLGSSFHYHSVRKFNAIEAKENELDSVPLVVITVGYNTIST